MKLSLKSAADALGLPVSTVERWIRQGRIPMQKSGADVIFTHGVLEKWAATHNLSFSPNDSRTDARPEEAVESLASAMKRGGVWYDVAGQVT